MSAGWHLVVLAVLFWALRSRLPWSRVGGAVLLAAVVGGLYVASGREGLRQRASDPDLWPAFVFVALASALAWWTMHREQRRTTPIHEAEGPESLARWVPRSWPGLVLVLLMAALLPASLGLPPLQDAAPSTVSASARVPWFLLGLVEWSRHLGPLLAWVVLPTTVVAGLFLTPFLDTSRPETEGPFRGRREEAPFFLWVWLGFGMAPLAAALVLWPAGDPAEVERVPLAEWLWLDVLSRRPPPAWIVREILGLALLALVAVGLPGQLPRWSATRGVFGRHRRRLGRTRYALLCVLLVGFMLVPLGLLVRVLGFGPWLRFGPEWWL